MMRGFTSRFALGALVLGSLLVLADTAQGGLIFRRGARGAVVANACCDVGYAGAPYGVGYAQPMYYPSTTVGYASGCCPQTGGYAYAPTVGYGRTMYYPSTGIQPAGGYYSGYPSGAIPAGGVPLTMPTPYTTRPGDPTATGDTRAVEATAVKITDDNFAPSDLNLKVGSTVKWTNEGKKPHTVTSDKNDWGSNELAPGQTFTATFTKAGTFEYHCKLHPDMKAKITVK